MPPPPPTNQYPGVDDIQRVAAFTDPVMRNLHITQCYHELAVAMTGRMGMSANWCTFATWASKQAGQTIRKEDLSRTLEHILQATFSAQSTQDVVVAAQSLGSDRSSEAIHESVAEVLNPLTAFDRASDAVARGNKKVFEEIGHEFARFCAMLLNDTAFDEDRIREFCAGLRPGEPPDGQRYLQQAFTRYYQAFFETDAKTRAELILLANIEIGLHEQTRLQPEIAEAVEAGVVDRRTFRWRLITALFPDWPWLVWLRLFWLRLIDRPSPFDATLDALLAEARRLAHLVVTRYLLTIELPGDIRLRLGEDLPAGFPDALQQITLPDLQALLQQVDPTPDSTAGSGAVDWAYLPHRLHFIVDMFRCYQETPSLFEAPFTATQVAALKSGQLPEGRL